MTTFLLPTVAVLALAAASCCQRRTAPNAEEWYLALTGGLSPTMTQPASEPAP